MDLQEELLTRSAMQLRKRHALQGPLRLSLVVLITSRSSSPSRSCRRCLLYGLYDREPRRQIRPKTIQLATGIWALRFLLVTLPITPLRRLTGWNVVIQYRRMLGLFAFFYASLHFASYIVLDQYFDFDAMLADIVKRPFITMGFTAFVLMVPARADLHEGLDPPAGAAMADRSTASSMSRRSARAIHFLWKVKVVIGDAGLLRRYRAGRLLGVPR